MGIEYTEDQKKVIELKNRNILVSAAAGSGKTAVLTERIVQKLRDENDRTDIDRLLIVTFTNAAAAEMRERIRLKIMECLEKEPENEHLQKQATLIHNAQITTIDSFCLFVIRNNFNDIGLDPGFRIADEGELKLMKQDVLTELLEEQFAQGNEDFIYCVECYTSGTTEALLEENILKLYDFSMSYPWPEEWLEKQAGDYAVESVEQLEATQWGQEALRTLQQKLQDCLEMMEWAEKICEQPDGPYMYGILLEEEKERLAALQKAQSLSEWENGIEKVQFGRLPAKKDASVNPVKRENVKKLRDGIKAEIKDIKEKYFFQPLIKSVEQCNACERAVEELLRLTLLYKEKLDQKKRDKNIIDFSDMEHFALEILLEKKEDGSVVPSKTALDYRAYFKEIMIDEYQDSNLVQEYLLKSISGEEEGNFNRFMVGDVKQSIYKFRLARPEIFMEKYHTYTQEESEKQRIDLHMNFRSRSQVVDSANFVFYQTMGEALGGIAYDDKAALYFGASFLPQLPKEAETAEEWNDNTELLLIEKPEKTEELTAKESEAYVIAKRIKSLLRENMVTDKDSGELRRVKYRDIVILLRSNSGWDEEFKKVFQEEGIPAYISSKTGYFKTVEIRSVMQYLRILDNPRQEIPLFGAMHSVFGGFTEEEAARIKALTKEQVKRGAAFYERLLCLMEMETTDEDMSSLLQKTEKFLKDLNRYRSMLAYMPIHELLQLIFKEYDYLLYVSALPGGEQRRANVEMLLEKAVAFEQTSYHGLFHFIRYMEQLEKYDVDYGEAGTMEEEADVVRIMSIHKSKGLEFPICFVAGLSKRFNMQDTTQPIIADVDMGIGTDFVDPKRRIRCKTLRKNVMAGKMRLDNIAEELRILYVALTRAKEKLILTGTLEKTLEKLSALTPILMHKERCLPFSVLSSAGSYMDFILAAFIRHPAIHTLLRENGIDTGYTLQSDLQAEKVPLRVELITTETLVKEETEEQVLQLGRREQLAQLKAADYAEEAVYQRLHDKFSFVYPYENLANLYTKTTVSELKKAGQAEEEDFSFHLIEETEVVPYIPAFMKEKEQVSGSTRGSAMHRIMELLDLQSAETEADVKAQMELEWKEGRLSEEYKNAVRVEKIAAFLSSSLCLRMKAAEKAGKLFRESPFVYGISAERLSTEFPKEETVLVQGIIDIYFEEEGELVAADYKTDVVKTPKELVERYRVQLDYYAEALERLCGKKVKEKIIYSFYLGEEIILP